jgi:tetratricopeptide (TPR) repeat protein
MTAQTETEELVAKGLEAFTNGHIYLAMTCLEQAAKHGKTAIICSYLSYCLAANRQQYEEAIRLGHEALGQEPNNPAFCLNLGRVYLLAGRKVEAISTLRQGLAFTKDQQIIAELDKIGTRKPPVFRKLHRDHFLNKYLGLLLSRLGLR